MTNGILSSTLSAIYSNGFSRLDVYEKLIGKAFSSTNIPFEEPWYGQLYSEKAKDLKWLASSLIINAEKEAEGARQLWKMANKVNNNRWSNLIRQHAIDEARHAKIYLRLFELIFPGSADNDLQNYFATLAPKYSMNEIDKGNIDQSLMLDEDQLIDQIIQINIREIRTRANQLLLEKALKYCCTEESRSKVEYLLKSVITDETRHIHYTAVLLEELITNANANRVTNIAIFRMNQFCQLTLEETGKGCFDQ